MALMAKMFSTESLDEGENWEFGYVSNADQVASSSVALDMNGTGDQLRNHYYPQDSPFGKQHECQVKMHTTCSNFDDIDTTLSKLSTSVSILRLPVELLEEILKKLNFAEIARLRMVCHSFNNAASTILNKAFHKTISEMQSRFQIIKGKMPRRESLKRKHPLARECDIVETIHMRLTVLQMTFGRHISRNHCCFFPGEILDEIEKIVLGLKEKSTQLPRAYKVTDELFDLTTMAMEYFKDKIEPDLPRISYFTSPFSEIPTGTPARIMFPMTVAPPSPASVGAPTVQTTLPSPPQPHQPKHRTSDVASLKRELKMCKNRMLYQHKKILECESKLEQQEHRFQEQDRKIETLVKELQACRSHLKGPTAVAEKSVVFPFTSAIMAEEKSNTKGDSSFGAASSSESAHNHLLPRKPNVLKLGFRNKRRNLRKRKSKEAIYGLSKDQHNLSNVNNAADNFMTETLKSLRNVKHTVGKNE